MIKKKIMWIISLWIYCLNIPFFLQASTEKIVMIDPGHGGFDPGKIGINGTYEKQINLSIAKELKKYLEDKGIEVVMTRESDEDLDGMEGKAHKNKDMQKRKEAINNSKADILISIHQNAFTDSKVKGFQVFYYTGSVGGEQLAGSVDQILKEKINPENKRPIKDTNNYYVLRVTKMPAIIVECGFLSNEEEEALLKDSKYQERLAHAIGEGILTYFSRQGIEKTKSLE